MREVRSAAVLLLLLGAVLSLAGCAEMHEATGLATQQDVFQIRQDMAAAQQAAQRAKSEVESLSTQIERRVRDQTGANERQVAALTKQVDSLTDTLTTLSARMEELGARLDTVGRQMRTITPPATAPRAPGTVTPGPGPSSQTPSSTPPMIAAPVPPAVPPSRPTTGSLQPQDIYQASYIDFSKGSYSLAIAGFREFLRRYPDHELAGSAQYWIGEAYLSVARGFTDASQGDKASESLELAVQEFKKVLANYPRADKVPTALYKEALALIDLKQPALAQARLQYLVDNFPRAEETSLARERLSSLRGR